MLLSDVWVIGRNNSDRPTLGHALVEGTASVTQCGVDVSGWSRSFIPTNALRYLPSSLCRSCQRKTGLVRVGVAA